MTAKFPVPHRWFRLGKWAAVLTSLGLAAWTWYSWPEDTTMRWPTKRPTVDPTASALLRSDETPATLVRTFGSDVRIAWLRAKDWKAVVDPQRTTRPDPERFLFTPAPDMAPTDLVEPPALIDGGGKDFDSKTDGTWLDRQGAFAIWVLDTADGVERELVPRGRLYSPLITPDGKHVVFTRETVVDREVRGTVWQRPWHGGDEVRLADGHGLWIADDPQTQERWLYGTDRFTELWRLSLSTGSRHMLYRGALMRRLSVTPDLRYACGEFPWPDIGLLDLSTGVVDDSRFRRGCNSHIAPDGSGMVSILNGGHTGVTLVDPQGGIQEVGLIPPGMRRTRTGSRGNVWSPKWAVDSHHIILSGPISSTSSTSDAADLWIGVLADDRSVITSWIQVTDSDDYDAQPFIWRAPMPAAGTGVADPRRTARPERTRTPAPWSTRPGLLAAWSGGTDRPTSETRMALTPAGWARIDQNRDLLLNGGRYEMRLTDQAVAEIAPTRSSLGVEVVFRLFSTSPAVAKRSVLVDLGGLVSPGQVFRLVMEERTLILETGDDDSRRAVIIRITDDQFHQVSIGYTRGSASAFFDANPVSFAHPPAPLDFTGKGQALTGGQWHGVLAGLRLTDGAAQADHASEDLRYFRAELAKRPVISRRTVRVAPLSRSRVPQPSSILPYRSALVVDTYRVTRGDRDLATDAICHVAHFRIIDSQTVALPTTKTDGEFELTLEPFSVHPELESVFLVDPADRTASERIWVEADR